MLQVATFLVPQEQDKANEVLKAHKPEGQVHFNKDTIVVFYSDGVYGPAAQIADLQELLESAQVAKIQQEIALHMLKAEIADLKPKQARYRELDDAIINTQRALDTQDLKMALQGIEWAILDGFCRPTNGWLEGLLNAWRCVCRQTVAGAVGKEAGGYVDDPLRGAAALPPRSMGWTTGSLGTRGNARLRPHTRRPCPSPDESWKAGEKEDDRSRWRAVSARPWLKAAVACRLGP